MKKALLTTRLRRRIDRLLKSRVGQSTTEYILILAIVVMIAGKLKSTLTQKVVGTVSQLDFDSVLQNN
jgi:hypothetical protein